MREDRASLPLVTLHRILCNDLLALFIMNQHEVKERIGRAMRAMKKEPKALLFIDGNTDWTCDTPEICGVPVLHGVGLSCSRWGTDPEDCPFVPLGATDAEITYHDRRIFADAWLG